MIPTDRLQEIIADAEAATVEPWYLSVCRELIELREQRGKVLAIFDNGEEPDPCPPRTCVHVDCEVYNALGVSEEADRV